MASETALRPHDVMRLVSQDRREELLAAESIWLCLTCETCVDRCPNECDPARTIDALREMASAEAPASVPRALAAFHRSFLDQVRLTGRLFERGLLLGGLAGTEFEPAEGFLDRLRMVKDPEDVEAMRQACRIAEEALRLVMDNFRRGMTEKEIANALKIEMLRLGTEELPKEPVVSSGARSAFPHTKTSDRPVNLGDALMIDTGARYHGYCSDITRTFFVGTPPPEFIEIYELELTVRRRVLETIRAGISLSLLDETAHRVVDDAGFGQRFPHRVGRAKRISHRGGGLRLRLRPREILLRGRLAAAGRRRRKEDHDRRGYKDEHRSLARTTGAPAASASPGTFHDLPLTGDP